MSAKISQLTTDSGPTLADSFIETERSGSSFKMNLQAVADLIASAGGSDIFKELTSDVAASTAGTAQPWFPSAGAAAVLAGYYEMQGALLLTLASMSSAQTMTVSFGGTATVGSIDYAVHSTMSAFNSNVIAPFHAIHAVDVNAQTIALTNGLARLLILRGLVRFTGAGTFIPRFAFGTGATITSPVAKAGTKFLLRSIGTSNPLGTWS